MIQLTKIEAKVHLSINGRNKSIVCWIVKEFILFIFISIHVIFNYNLISVHFVNVRALKELFLISVYCNKESHKIHSCFNSQIYIL